MDIVTCLWCGKVLGSAKKLEDHVVAEHGIKRFDHKCRHRGCSARFVTEEQLNRHKVSHAIGSSEN